jgi:hypothetical protein
MSMHPPGCATDCIMHVDVVRPVLLSDGTMPWNLFPYNISDVSTLRLFNVVGNVPLRLVSVNVIDINDVIMPM